MSSEWVMKQDRRRVGEWNRPGFVSLGGRPDWRGPSNPPSAVHDVPAGDLIVHWDTTDRVVVAVYVSLGFVTTETWHDERDDVDVTCEALWYVPIAACECEVTDDEFDAIAGPLHNGLRPHARTTLKRLPPTIGRALVRRIIKDAVEESVSAADLVSLPDLFGVDA